MIGIVLKFLPLIGEQPANEVIRLKSIENCRRDDCRPVRKLWCVVVSDLIEGGGAGLRTVVPVDGLFDPAVFSCVLGLKVEEVSAGGSRIVQVTRCYASKAIFREWHGLGLGIHGHEMKQRS